MLTAVWLCMQPPCTQSQRLPLILASGMHALDFQLVSQQTLLGGPFLLLVVHLPVELLLLPAEKVLKLVIRLLRRRHKANASATAGLQGQKVLDDLPSLQERAQ